MSTRGSEAEPTLMASVVSGLAMFAVSLGIPMGQVMAAAKLDPVALADPDGRIPYRNALELWALIDRTLPNRAHALTAARAFPYMKTFGPVAYASRNAADVRHLITLWNTYQRVISSDIEMALVDEPNELPRYTIRHPEWVRSQRHVPEIGVAVAYLRLSRLTASDNLVREVWFSHSAGAEIAEYRDFFGVDVHFEAPQTGLVFHDDALSQPVVDPDPRLYHFILSHLDTLNDALPPKLSPGEDALEDVRSALTTLAGRGSYSAEALAAELAISVRTLQRRVSASGTTVRALLDTTRETHARQLLRESKLTVDDVAFLVGYSEERAFTRAFKRWTGRTPAQFRRAALHH